VANELRHSDVGPALSKSEWEGTTNHYIADNQASGDIIFASGAIPNPLIRLAIGSSSEILAVNSTGTAPEWIAQSAITSLTGLTTIGAASATTNIVAGDLTMYNAVADGNPTVSLGSSAAERMTITASYDSGEQTLNYIEFATAVASTDANKGKFIFDVDGDDIATIDDGGIDLAAGKTFAVDGVDIVVTTYTAGDGLDLGGTEFSTDLMANGGLEIQSTELSVAQGISQYNVAQFTTGVVDTDFLKISGTAVEGRSASEVLSDIGAAPSAGDTNILTVGTIGTGTWQGTAVAPTYGGTGADMSTIAKGGILAATGTGTIGITAVGTDDYVLTADSTAAGGVAW